MALSWMPKATVQAAMGPLALGKAKDALEHYLIDHPGKGCDDIAVEDIDLQRLCSFIGHGEKLLTIAVMVILLTAPIGAIAIMVFGPKLLHKDTVESDQEPETA